MIARAALETIEALREFGFVREVETDWQLVRDFGNLKITACECMNLRLAQIVQISGVFKTPHRIVEVDIEMPRVVRSVEHAGAWLAWHLDRQISPKFEPQHPAPWLDEGRRNAMLLSWVAERAEYAARPCCFADRELVRPMLKQLKVEVSRLTEYDFVWFSFDGEVLKVRWEHGVLAVAAKGSAWPKEYCVIAGQLMRIPPRLTHTSAYFSVWRGVFTLANVAFEIHTSSTAAQ